MASAAGAGVSAGAEASPAAEAAGAALEDGAETVGGVPQAARHIAATSARAITDKILFFMFCILSVADSSNTAFDIWCGEQKVPSHRGTIFKGHQSQ